MDCDTTLHALSCGYLEWEDAEYLAVHAHLEGCPACCTHQGELRATLELLRLGDPAAEVGQAPVLRLPPPRRAWPGGWALPAAAAVLIAFAGFWAGRQMQQVPPVDRPTVSHAAPAPVTTQQPRVVPVAARPQRAQVPAMALTSENLRVLRLREFALQAQVALAVMDRPEPPPAGTPERQRLFEEGLSLFDEFRAAEEWQLAGLLQRTLVALQGGPESEELRTRTFAELGRLRLGVTPRVESQPTQPVRQQDQVL